MTIVYYDRFGSSTCIGLATYVPGIHAVSARENGQSWFHRVLIPTVKLDFASFTRDVSYED